MLHGLLYVGDEIFDVLDSDTHPEEAVGNSDSGALLRRHVLVRAVPRLNDERVDTPEAGRVSEQLQCLCEPHGGRTRAPDLDSQHTPESVEERLRDLVIRMARKSGIMHLRDLGSLRAPLRDLHRVFVLTLHSDVEGLQPANGSGAWPQTIILRRTSSMNGSFPHTTPARMSWCPFRNLVAEWMTTST